MPNRREKVIYLAKFCDKTRKLTEPSSELVGLTGNRRRAITISPMPRMPFRGINGRLEAACGRSGMKPRNEKPCLVACYSIECGNWVGRNRFGSADSRIQVGVPIPIRFMQQTPAKCTIFFVWVAIC